MSDPQISIIIPVYNEARRLPRALDKVLPFLADFRHTWEIIIVENGSTDNTYHIANDYAWENPDVYVIRSKPAKGQAVKTGMLYASGRWRYMCDVDLSTPIHYLPRFLAMGQGSLAEQGAPIVIGSREVQESQRINEPKRRHTMGRAFNRVVQSVLIPGISDSQCGFKLFRGDVVEKLFTQQTLKGWAFDVEILYLARLMNLQVIELGVPWTYDPDSRVRPGRDALAMLRDLWQVKRNALIGVYG